MSTPNTDFLEVVINEVSVKTQPSVTLDERNIFLVIDGLEALKQSLERMLLTERYWYTIYDQRYGTELFELFGNELEYAKLDISRRIKESLFEDDRVESVHSFVIDIVKDKLTVRCVAESIFGTVELEVSR